MARSGDVWDHPGLVDEETLLSGFQPRYLKRTGQVINCCDPTDGTDDDQFYYLDFQFLPISWEVCLII